MCRFKSGLWAGILLHFVASTGSSALAQSMVSDGGRRALRGDAQARLLETDSLLEFRTRSVEQGRVDVDEGILRANYRIGRSAPRTDDAASSARDYLSTEARSYGLESTLRDLVLTETRRTPHSAHVLFQQVYDGVPVLNRTVKVSLDREGRPTMVLSGYAPRLRRHRRLSVIPTVSAEAALQRALADFSSAAEVAPPELFVFPEDPPRLVWRVYAMSFDPSADWEILVDAHGGEIVRVMELSVHKRGNDPDLFEPTGAMVSEMVDGSGLIFNPDPVTSAGVEYGPPYIDSNDADVIELNAQRKAAVLREITRGGDGLWRLEGPNVIISGDAQIGGLAFTPPAELDQNAFRYLRSNPFFEAVVAYYHVDASQRYSRSLHPALRSRRTILVNPRGISTDDSQYYPLRHAIAFGIGGIDDAEDAGVIWHESAHALLENESPGLLSTYEGRAFHEGWGDYWAGSYVRDLIERAEVPLRDWRRLFAWDGNNGSWCGRIIEHPGRYPDQTGVGVPSGCREHGNIYQLGLLWAATLMEIYDALGRSVTDRLNLASHSYLNPPLLMTDAAEALIQADVDLFGGGHTDVLIRILAERGFVDAENFGPILTHEPLRNTEDVGSAVPVVVIARGTASPIDSVMVFHGTSPVPVDRLVLAPVGDGAYRADLQLPSQPDTLRYYVEAVDQGRRRSRLPAGDAGASFEVIVGPDTRAPVIVHAPIEQSSIAAWPVDLVAEVTDDIAVDSVWAEFRLMNQAGTLLRQGEFGLTSVGSLYVAPFPIPVEDLSDGSTVRYRLLARDAAEVQNLAEFPENGEIRMMLMGGGVLRAFDFEGPEAGILANGVWSRGEPTFGVLRAHSSSNVWATSPTGSYPASAQRSTLELPPLNLENVDGAYLVFWHWYDFEHNGQAEPGVFKGIPLWDGGNVKISDDDGVTWTVAVPQGGYNGTISAGGDNPLAGEAAFGGYSYGWRREILALPSARQVRIRYDFGTDGSNSDESLSYAGWYLDDVSVITEQPDDGTAPLATSIPDRHVERSPGQAPPIIFVEAFDAVGVERAQIAYESSTASGDVAVGLVRMVMADTSLSWFFAGLPADRTYSAGDRIDYRVLLADYSGNQTVTPPYDQPAFRVSYVYGRRTSILTGARPSGNWSRADTTWTSTAGPEVERSALVLDPIDMPADAERLTLELRHAFALDAAVGANVKITSDGGRTWAILWPEGGYPGTLNVSPGHVMSGEAVFTGESGGAVLHRFDLTGYYGEQVQLRLDLGAARILRPAEMWKVYEAAISLSGLDPDFPIAPSLALHPNFPDPFSDNTTVTYSLSTGSHVRLDVFDVLGRRVSTLVDEEQPAGVHTLLFDGSVFVSGVYLLRMRVGNTQRIERMVIAR